MDAEVGRTLEMSSDTKSSASALVVCGFDVLQQLESVLVKGGLIGLLIHLILHIVVSRVSHTIGDFLE